MTMSKKTHQGYVRYTNLVIRYQ